MTQRQINAAHVRSLKTTYKHLSPHEKCIVKLQEQIDSYDKSLSIEMRLLKDKYGNNWRKTAPMDKTDMVLGWMLEQINLSEKITGIEEKYNLSRDDIMKKHRTINSHNNYFGSF